MSNGTGSTISSILKELLTSPVGGWALAVVMVTAMAYVTFRDRQTIYADVVKLRENAMPLIRENHEMAKEILSILKEQRQ